MSQAEITMALEHVQEREHAIADIAHVTVGANGNSSNHQEYTYGFIMHFSDAEAFKRDAPRPAHQPVSEELQRICQSIIDFDLLS